MKVVVVGFKLTEENSVYYKKVDLNDENVLAKLEDSFGEENAKMIKMGAMLNGAATAGADFVSVRFIREAGE